ncbi:MAG: histidine phosphatase family protein [Patescibacteria group bacterium]
MKIYVIRHGLTELNKAKKVNGEIDEPLAKEGIEQAKAIIPLIPKSVKYIYTSPLLRARQTAEIISSKLNLPIYIQGQLTEIHMGSLAGKSWEEMEGGLVLKKKHRTVKFNYHSYGGESVEDVKKRLIPFFKNINTKHANNQVLIITHGGVIRLIHLLEYGESVYETEKHVSLLTFDRDKILKNYIKVQGLV